MHVWTQARASYLPIWSSCFCWANARMLPRPQIVVERADPWLARKKTGIFSLISFSSLLRGIVGARLHHDRENAKQGKIRHFSRGLGLCTFCDLRSKGKNSSMISADRIQANCSRVIMIERLCNAAIYTDQPSRGWWWQS